MSRQVGARTDDFRAAAVRVLEDGIVHSCEILRAEHSFQLLNSLVVGSLLRCNLTHQRAAVRRECRHGPLDCLAIVCVLLESQIDCLNIVRLEQL